MNFPSDLKYTKDHAWVRREGNTATVGITDFAQRELSDIVYVEVETVGDTLSQDTIFGTVEAIKTVSDLFMPIAGEVVAFNESLLQHPEKVNKHPYTEGWIIKIKPTQPQEYDLLLSEEEYNELYAQV